MISHSEAIINRDRIIAKDQLIFNRCHENKGTYLNLGCGDRVLSGFVNVEKYTSRNEVFRADIGDLPFQSKTVDLIFSAHSLEHLPIRKSKLALRDWYRVLKPGGRLILEIPDLESIFCKLLQFNDRPEFTWYLYTLFGYQIDPRYDDRPDAPVDLGQFHQSGHTKDTINRELTFIGFKVIEVVQYDGYATPSLHIDAMK